MNYVNFLEPFFLLIGQVSFQAWLAISWMIQFLKQDLNFSLFRFNFIFRQLIIINAYRRWHLNKLYLKNSHLFWNLKAFILMLKSLHCFHRSFASDHLSKLCSLTLFYLFFQYKYNFEDDHPKPYYIDPENQSQRSSQITGICFWALFK